MSGRRVVRSDEAENDLLEIALYLASQADIDTGVRFLEQAESAFATLAESPLIGAPRMFRLPSLAKVRSWSVPGFHKHLIFYRPLEDGVEVLRVVHGSRLLDVALGDEPAGA